MRVFIAAFVLLALSARAEDSGKRRRPPPQEYGRVVMNNHAAKAKVGPVTFDHWLHRAKYTCRVCHVDVGFAMKAGGTDIRATDNAAGQYCGACHNEKTKTADGEKLFAACKPGGNPASPACERCHSTDLDGSRKVDFPAFAKDLPKGRFGNGIDWEQAESKHLVRPIDYIEGISFRRPAMPAQKDFALSAKLAGMPEIIFSHAKHTVWSGCEGCHPEIFVGVRRGATKYTMVDIFEGRSCGVCHVNVAFPTIDCQRCHSKPVQ